MNKASLSEQYCDKDLLQALFTNKVSGGIVLVSQLEGKQRITIKVFGACKGECDKILSEQDERENCTTEWLGVSDLVIPSEFITKFFSFMNQIREGRAFTDKAYDELKDVFLALSQKVLRAMTEEEWQRVCILQDFKL